MRNNIIIFLLLLFIASCSSIADVEESKGNEGISVDKWISEVLEYVPAPGQFINEGMGNMAASKKLVGGTSIVSLGSFGGYVVFRFNHDVVNGVGDDFVVLGNAYRDAMYPECSSSEPGIVQVSYDENGNGKADDKWYELRGANHDNEGVIRGYEVTYKRPEGEAVRKNVEWSDNKGNSGILSVEETLSYHKSGIYPLGEFFNEGEVPETMTFKGTLMPANAVKEAGDAQYWKLYAFGDGYADNYSSEYDRLVGEDKDTKGGNKFDIANAIDENGDSVNLPKVTFIKVYSSVLQSCGWIGETSTEVCGAISLRVPKN